MLKYAYSQTQKNVLISIVNLSPRDTVKQGVNFLITHLCEL